MAISKIGNGMLNAANDTYHVQHLELSRLRAGLIRDRRTSPSQFKSWSLSDC